MLRTNLSTRPFYNERLVYLVLSTTALVVVALTVFNVLELRSLTRRHGQLGARVSQAETRAARFRQGALEARRAIDPEEIETVSIAAREANALIDQRTFSWTDLLNRLETTLPDSLRIQAIRPRTDKQGALVVSLVVVGRKAEDVAAFVEALQKSHAFKDMYSRTETTNQQGLLEVVVEGRYRPATTPPAPPAREAARADTPAPARED